MKRFGRRKKFKVCSGSFFLDQNELALHKIFVSTKLIADKQIRTLPEVLKWTNRNCAHERQELGHQGGRGDSQKVIMMRRMENKRKNLKHCWVNSKLFSLRIVIE